MKVEMIPLLRKAVEWAEVEAKKPPKKSAWNQLTTYQSAKETKRLGKSCGSAYCIAGWVMSTAHGVDDPYEAVVMRQSFGGVMVGAQELLGLTIEEAGDLFAPLNTIEEVRSIAERIAGEPL